jgi:hypothetical protein
MDNPFGKASNWNPCLPAPVPTVGGAGRLDPWNPWTLLFLTLHAVFVLRPGVRA